VYTVPKQPDLVDFIFVVDILWHYDMFNAGFKNQVIGN